MKNNKKRKIWIRRVIACLLAFLMLFPAFSAVFAKEAIGICTADDGSCSNVVIHKNDQNKNQFMEISMGEALEVFRNKKDAILYFGFDTCPWCKEVKPVLRKAADKKKVTVYYVKVRDQDRNLLYSDDQRAELTKYIPKYMSRNKKEDNKLWLYVPLVIHVKKGKAVAGHKGTVKGHDATKRKMTKKEKKKLEKIYSKILQ